ncbi:MAG TPA: hypothetical protein VNZ52_01365 [Candidatus Thermoplasmatota archaeon]|nr:hypothetical protein [Candidatus Thermoplasmatota archaeon]
MPAKMFCPKCGKAQRSPNHLCQPNIMKNKAKAAKAAAASAARSK